MTFHRESAVYPQVGSAYDHTVRRVTTYNRCLFASDKEDLQDRIGGDDFGNRLACGLYSEPPCNLQ